LFNLMQVNMHECFRIGLSEFLRAEPQATCLSSGARLAQ
jgi:hypothetical protein